MNNLEVIKKSIYPQIKGLVLDDPDGKKALSVYSTVVRLASNPKIAVCDPVSVVVAFTQAIDLGLNLDPLYGECDFLPYNGKLAFQPRAKGIAALAEREGGWQIQVLPVFNCDIYESEQVFNDGWLDEKITFKPNIAEREEHAHDEEWVRENLRFVLCNARRQNNGKLETYSLTLTKNMVESRRLMSTAQKPGKFTPDDDRKRLAQGLPIGIWREHYTAMAYKTGLAAISRKLPKSKNIEKLLNVLDAQDRTIDSTSTTIAEPAKTEPLTITEIPANSVDFSIDTETGEVLDVQNHQNEQQLTKDVVSDLDYWTVAVDDTVTNAELTELLAEIPDNVKIELEHVIDAKFDSFAKAEPEENPVNDSKETAPLDKYTDIRTALNECENMGSFARLHNNMDAKTKTALINEIKATQDRLKSQKVA